MEKLEAVDCQHDTAMEQLRNDFEAKSREVEELIEQREKLMWKSVENCATDAEVTRLRQEVGGDLGKKYVFQFIDVPSLSCDAYFDIACSVT